MKSEKVFVILVYIISLLSLDIYFIFYKEYFSKSSDEVVISFILTNVVVSIVLVIEVIMLIIDKRNNIKK